MKEFNDWKGDFMSFVKPGDAIDHGIFYFMMADAVPRLPHRKGYLMGEAYTHDIMGKPLYMCFLSDGSNYRYHGLMSEPAWELYCTGSIGRLSKEGNWIVDDSDHMGTATEYRNWFNGRPGWMQLHSKQDSEFYGVWINRDEKRTFTFCEGDITTVHCLNNHAFGREYQAICKFHEVC